MDPPKHAVCELTLDFTNAKTEADLWAECKRVLCPKFDDFGANLDALVDILRGGFGLMTPFKLTILGRDSALASAPQRWSIFEEIFNESVLGKYGEDVDSIAWGPSLASTADQPTSRVVVPHLKAGAASQSITPSAEDGCVELGGYWGRTPGAEPTFDPENPLTCRCLVLETEKNVALVITLDVVGLDDHTSERLRWAASKTAGVPFSATVICCSHTHTGPLTHRGFIGMGAVHEPYVAFLERAIVACSAAACNAVEPCVARNVQCSGPASSFGINRRVVAPAATTVAGADAGAVADDDGTPWYEKCGRCSLGENPLGPRPTTARALVLDRVATGGSSSESGTTSTPVAVLWSYPCHPNIAGKASSISADWPGAACVAIEAALPTTTALFVNGACGDINPAGLRGAGPDAAREQGAALAALLIAGIAGSAAPAMVSSAHVACVRRVVALPLAPRSSPERARAWAAETSSAAATATAAAPAPRHDVATAALAAQAVLSAEGSPLQRFEDARDTRDVEVFVLTLGEHFFTLVGCGAELFFSFDRHLRADLDVMAGEPGGAAEPWRRTHASSALIVAGLANGCIGYLPGADRYDEGGYECVCSHVVYGHTRPLARSAHGVLLHAAAAAVRSAWRRVESAAGDHHHRLRARVIPSGFPESHDTYNGIGVERATGDIYYVLCAEEPNVAGRLYRYAVETSSVQLIGDLSEACGESSIANLSAHGGTDDGGDVDQLGDQLEPIAQGKIHCTIADGVQGDGKLYLATHVGFYTYVDGRETLPSTGLPVGMSPYAGGHALRYDPHTSGFTSLGVANTPHGAEGYLAFAVDATRGVGYGITWPAGYFIVVDLGWTRSSSSEAPPPPEVLGPISRGGEAAEPVSGGDFRTLCRCIAVDPISGRAYVSTAEGEVLCYDREGDRTLTPLPGVPLRKAYFGRTFDVDSPGTMAWNWRQVLWCARERVFYGVHGNSGYLFRFNPAHARRLGAESFEIVERLTSTPSRRRGDDDMFSYGYLGLAFFPDGRTLGYLTGGATGAAVTALNKGASKGDEELHLVTYNVATGVRIDHGAIAAEDGGGTMCSPSYCNSLAIGNDGSVYALARCAGDGTDRSELFVVDASDIRGL